MLGMTEKGIVRRELFRLDDGELNDSTLLEQYIMER